MVLEDMRPTEGNWLDMDAGFRSMSANEQESRHQALKWEEREARQYAIAFTPLLAARGNKPFKYRFVLLSGRNAARLINQRVYDYCRVLYVRLYSLVLQFLAETKW